MLVFNKNEAMRADQTSSMITETGKYIGTITRAEKLIASTGTQGLGISFKSDTGETADYLDLYCKKSNGDLLSGSRIANAILGCLKLRQVEEGQITCEKYNKDTKSREKVTVTGYPGLMGQRIGLLLQKELAVSQTGADVSRMQVFGVFEPQTELTVSEILTQKTKPEKLEKMVQYLSDHPIRDSRKNKSAAAASASSSAGAFGDFDDSIPF